MKKLTKNHGGYSLIGLWPWTGVYAGLVLLLAKEIGFALSFFGLTISFFVAAKLVERAYPELSTLTPESGPSKTDETVAGLRDRLALSAERS